VSRRAILFDYLPEDVDLRHTTLREASGINGGDTFYTNATKAVLKHSTYDVIYFLQQSVESSFSLQTSAEFIANRNRVQIIRPRELRLLQQESALILFSPTESAARLLPLRRFLKLDASPVIGFLHAATPSWYFPRLLNLIVGGVQPHDAIVCPSAASRRVVHKQYDALLHAIGAPQRALEEAVTMPLIPIGIDSLAFGAFDRQVARSFYGYGSEDVVMLYMGRFNMFGKSDLAPLISTVSLIRSRTNKQVKLLLAGADHGDRLRSQIRAYCDTLLPEGTFKVVCNPTDEEKKIVYAAADIFVSLADGIAESFGISVVEAMAAGLPVVCTDWDGYREIITEGVTGYRIGTSWIDLDWLPESLEAFGMSSVSTLAATTVVDIDQLAHRLLLLTEDAALRRAMGARAREKARMQLDWSVVVERYEEVFSECLGRAVHSRRSLSTSLLRHQDLFSHYPSQHVAEDSEIFITPAGRTWLSERTPLAIHYQDSNKNTIETSGFKKFGLIDPEVCALLLRQLLDVDSLGFHLLADAVVEQSGCDRWLARLHIARALKYGLVARMNKK